MTCAVAPTYLIELFNLETGELDLADVSGDLALALETVYWHLMSFNEVVRVRVSEDDAQELEGIAFMRSDESFVATITVYHLDREQGTASEYVKALHNAAALSCNKRLQAVLTQLF
jgi:hypothetical protein